MRAHAAALSHRGKLSCAAAVWQMWPCTAITGMHALQPPRRRGGPLTRTLHYMLLQQVHLHILQQYQYYTSSTSSCQGRQLPGVAGLDAASALFCARAVLQLARQGAAVILSIHQPSAEVCPLPWCIWLLVAVGARGPGAACAAGDTFAPSAPWYHVLLRMHCQLAADASEIGLRLCNMSVPCLCRCCIWGDVGPYACMGSPRPCGSGSL